MVDTTTATKTTLSHALRTAADLCDRIAYAGNITWSGRSEIGLHAKTDEQYAALIGSLPGGSTRTMSGDDWEVDLYELPTTDGLIARVYGPRRKPAEPGATAPVVDLMAALKTSVDRAKADRRKQAEQQADR